MIWVSGLIHAGVAIVAVLTNSSKSQTLLLFMIMCYDINQHNMLLTQARLTMLKHLPSIF